MITTYRSFEFLNPAPDNPGAVSPISVARPLEGFVLCGGGGTAHHSHTGSYLFAVEPTSLNPATPTNLNPPPITLTPSQQPFTAGTTSYEARHTNTAYAMGVKFTPPISIPGPGPAPPSFECSKQITLSLDAIASGHQRDIGRCVKGGRRCPYHKMDIANTRYSNSMDHSSYKGTEPVALCRVDIAWADGNSHPYKFNVDVSLDQTNWTNVLSDQQSTGTSNDFEPYTFQSTNTKFVRITITQSVPGIAFPIAQISEIKVFGRTLVR